MIEKNLNPQDGINDDWKDKLVVLGKGMASLIPMVGGPLAEIVGVVVPGQRIDRIATYLRNLARRIDDLEEEIKHKLSSNPERIDLIEEGGYQSARATSERRIEQIVEAVSRGLTENDADLIRRKRLMAIFGELDDDEVSLLNAFGRSYASMDRDAFNAINIPKITHFNSTQKDMDQEQLFKLGREHLIRLNLLRKNYSSIKKGQQPEFDPAIGDFKHRIEISPLGRMLLKEIGMITPFDQQQEKKNVTY